MAVITARTTAPAGLLAILPRVISRVSHDLNNSLARILGKSELALMMDDDTRYRSSFEEVLQAGNDARVLIADMQRFVSWSRGGHDPVPVSDTLGLVERLAQRGSEQHHVSLEIGPSRESLSPCESAALAASLWIVVQLAFDAVSSKQPGGATWRIDTEATERGVSTHLDCGVPILDPERRAELERAQRIGESVEGEIGEALAVIRAVDGALIAEGSRVEIVVPGAGSPRSRA